MQTEPGPLPQPDGRSQLLLCDSSWADTNEVNTHFNTCSECQMKWKGKSLEVRQTPGSGTFQLCALRQKAHLLLDYPHLPNEGTE